MPLPRTKHLIKQSEPKQGEMLLSSPVLQRRFKAFFRALKQNLSTHLRASIEQLVDPKPHPAAPILQFPSREALLTVTEASTAQPPGPSLHSSILQPILDSVFRIVVFKDSSIWPFLPTDLAYQVVCRDEDGTVFDS
jgi:hypothetical protein